MLIWRLHIGRVKHSNGSVMIWFEYDHAPCGCRILTICDIYFTWLVGDCWKYEKGILKDEL